MVGGCVNEETGPFFANESTQRKLDSSIANKVKSQPKTNAEKYREYKERQWCVKQQSEVK